jgi:hypothetical protein
VFEWPSAWHKKPETQELPPAPGVRGSLEELDDVPSSPKGQSSIVGSPRGARGSAAKWINTPHKLSDYVPKPEQWRLYINPSDHDAAQRDGKADPGHYYDENESPGYQQGMMLAYQEFLEKTPTEKPDAALYFQMSWVTSAHLPPWKKKLARTALDGRFGFGTGNPGQKIAADLQSERLAGRLILVDETHLVDDRAKFKRGSPDYLCRVVAEANGDQLIVPAYGETPEDDRGSRSNIAELVIIVQAAMTRFNTEARAARHDRSGVLRAIARLVRALHVIHPFNDGNGRLNIHLLLPRLLLQHGFPPVVPTGMSALFSGTSTVDQIVVALESAMAATPRAAAKGDYRFFTSD